MTQNKHKDFLYKSPIAFAYHQMLFDDSGEALDYIFLEVNPAFEKLTGLKADEIIGKKITEVQPGIRESNFDWVAYFGKILKEGLEDDFVQYSEPLGRWYHVFVNILEKDCFITYFSDFTKQKAAAEDLQYKNEELTVANEQLIAMEEELRQQNDELLTINQKLLESEDRFRIIFNESNSGLVVHKKGIIIEANQQFAIITGYSHEELINMNGLLLIVPEYRGKVRENINNNYEKIYEVEGLRKDGSRYPLELQGKEISYLGQNVRLTEFRDISERMLAEEALKDSEKRLANIIDFLPDPTLVINQEGKVLAWNQAVEELTGVSKEEIIGKGDYAYIKPFYGEARPGLIDMVLKEYMDIVGKYLYIQREGEKLIAEGYAPGLYNGRGAHIWIVAAPLYDQQHKKVGAIATIRDISQQKENERVLMEAKASAEATNQSKSQFLANMSHEIRTPLHGIIGLTELSLRNELTKDQKENLEIVQKSAESLLYIINDILDFSRMEAGKFTILRKKFNLVELMENTLAIHQDKVRDKKIELSYSFASELPDLWYGDALRIEQVLNNLISNALKFTEEGQVGVLIKAEEIDEDYALISFKVSDTGIGIAQEEMKNLFQVFSQLDGGYTRKYGGTGLGLAISKELVELMDGKIWVESKLGEGSTFAFTLPLARDKNNNQTLQAKKTLTNGFDLKDMQILLTEDQLTNQLFIKSLADRYKFNLDIAHNGIEAVSKYQEKEYDLILMDIQMPLMDGVEATRQIRDLEKSSGKHTPIIAVTAYALEGDREKFISMGMDYYLAKPFKIDKLLLLMEKIKINKQKKNNSTLEELYKSYKKIGTSKSCSITIKEIRNAYLNLLTANKGKNFSEMEKYALIIKEKAHECDWDYLKSHVFKITLAIRRNKYNEVEELLPKTEKYIEQIEEDLKINIDIDRGKQDEDINS